VKTALEIPLKDKPPVKSPVSTSPTPVAAAAGVGGDGGAIPPRVKPPRRVSAASSLGARESAAVILEVLSGLRSVGDASKALGVSPTRFYGIEQRAVEGLVTACEPRSKGRQKDPGNELAKREKECQRLRQDLLRHQALLRSAQRALGVTASPVIPALGKSGAAAGKGRRRKIPAKRAQMLALRLRTAVAAPESPPSPSTPPPVMPAADRSGG
jgi:hypothetical protein